MKFLQSALVYLALAVGANAADLDALRTGDMRKLNLHSMPKPVSDAVMVDADGVEHHLADWQGKHVLVNFWATWCAPCRQEMPSLAALQDAIGGAEFEVVTIATGRNSVEGIEAFFEEVGVTNLPVLMDQNQRMARDMAVLGLPATVILDPSGQEIGRLLGDADWNGPDARALLAALIGD